METQRFIKLPRKIISSRILKSVLSVVLALVILFTGLPQKVLAWNNTDAHPEINQLAIDLFERRRIQDDVLSWTFLTGDPCWGMAWDPSEGFDYVKRKPEVRRQKTLSQWIVDAGYSADEPEGPMALRHFYDPTNKSFLTDTDSIAAFLRLTVGDAAVNPEISAVDWAMDRDHGISSMKVIYEQFYSYPDAREYLKQALADKSRDNVNYGKAWRAVGETMHLVADMGCPAHVRNDGHGLGDGDPTEVGTTGVRVMNNFTTNWTSAINYDQGVEGLMHDLAAYTNKNFLSKDTITVMPGKTTLPTGRTPYPSPDISKLTLNSSKYLVGTVEGKQVRLARQSWWYRWGLSKKLEYEIDSYCNKDMQEVLMPTVVRSAESVLERFLPRFTVSAAVKPDPVSAGKFTVVGSITQGSSPEWSEKLVIRNGAYVEYNGKKEAVQILNRDDLNEFSHTITANPGDKLNVVYDLGGYLVRSPAVTIGQYSIDPPTLTGDAGKKYTFRAVVPSPAAVSKYEWAIDGSYRQGNASPTFETAIDGGDHIVRVKVYDNAGKEIGTAESKVTIKGRAVINLALKPAEYPAGYTVKNKFENVKSQTSPGSSGLADRVQYVFEKMGSKAIVDWNTNFKTQIQFEAFEALSPTSTSPDSKAQEQLEEKAAQIAKYYSSNVYTTTVVRKDETFRLWKVVNPGDLSKVTEYVMYTGVARVNQYIINFSITARGNGQEWAGSGPAPIPGDAWRTNRYAELEKNAREAMEQFEELLQTKYGVK